VFSRKGKSTATAGDFAVGDKVVARVSQRGAEPAGEVWLRELRDQASQADYERDRRGTTVGVVAAASANDRIAVRRPDNSVASFGVTKGTVFRKNGAPVRLDAFPVGSSVAVKPRAAFGKLNAAIVAGTLEEINSAHADTLSRWRGTVQSVDAEKKLLVLKRADDDAIRTVMLAPNVTVTKARGASAPLTLADVAPGAFVDLRLVKSGAAGNADVQRTAAEIRLTTPRKPRAGAGGEKP
jgi:hypothetical protein